MIGRPIVGKLSPEGYRAAMEELPIVTVDVLFLNPEKTKLLLGRRTNDPYVGQFFSFGGRLYKNEEFLDAACRIAKQEVGITLLPQALTFAGVLNEIGDSSVFEGVNYHAVDVYFVCTIDNEIVQLDSQHSEARWFSVDDASIHPDVRIRINSALRVLNTV